MDDDLDSPPRHVGLRDSETKNIVQNTTKINTSCVEFLILSLP